MKTSITKTTLALTLILILSGGCTTTTPIEDTTIKSDKPVICEKLKGPLGNKAHTIVQEVITKHAGKRIIFSTLGTICFQ